MGGHIHQWMSGWGPPAAPSTVAPVVIGSTTFTPKWTEVAGAASYRLDLSTASDFSSFITGYNDLSVGNVTKYRATGLTAGTTVYQRVRAVSDTGTSTDSDTRSVTLESSAHPNDIAGMSMRLEVDSLSLTNGDPVTTFPDNADTGLTAGQTTSAKKPVFTTNVANGYPALYFDGVDDYMDVDGNPVLGSLFVVTRLHTVMSNYNGLINSNLDAANSLVMSGDQPTGPTSWYTSGTVITNYYKDGVSGNSITNDTLAPHIYEGTRSTPGQLNTNWRFGTDRSNIGISREWPGYIFEIIAYDTVLSTADRQLVETYLTNKYIATFASATFSRTDDTDTASATASVRVKGSLSATDSTDTVASTAAAIIKGTLSATDANDTIASTVSGPPPVTATLTATDDTDRISSTGAVAVKGTLTTADASDTVSATTVARATATLTATDQNDTVSSTAGARVSATFTQTDSTDTVSSTGAVRIAATLTHTDANDSVTTAGAVQVKASTTIADGADTISATVFIGNPPVTLTAAVTDADDKIVSTAALPVKAALSTSDGDDRAASSGTVQVKGTLTTADGDDTASLTASILVAASLNTTDDTDGISSTATIPNPYTESTLVITDDNDTITATVFVPIPNTYVLVDYFSPGWAGVPGVVYPSSPEVVRSAGEVVTANSSVVRPTQEKVYRP